MAPTLKKTKPACDTKLTTFVSPSAAGEKLAPFYFRRLEDKFLITNDWGHHAILREKDFTDFTAAGIGKETPLWNDLASKGFIRESMDFQALSSDFISKNAFLKYAGPSLHMIVLTLRCNQKCHYCHASVVDPSQKSMDMTLETAKKTVDFIFSTPNPVLCIEFQGGEPMINWPAVKFIVEYAQKRAAWEKRKVILSMVTNFTLMTEEKLRYLMEKRVSICTSLDGPDFVHNQNRPFFGGGSSHDRVVHWIKRIQEICSAAGERTYYLPSALMTTTRFSLSYGKEIVDHYVSLGMSQVFLRALAPIGFAKRAWGSIGYSAEDFAAFYEKTLDYILDLNESGTPIVERLSLVLLTKILKRQDPGYMDLRSPSGAALSAVAYNHDGGIFAGDEGRMVAQEGDLLFKIGHVAEHSWQEAANHPTTAACAVASTLEGQPQCTQCAYKPYCGVEPVYHYETQDSISGNIPSSEWCNRHMKIFDILFRKLQNPRDRAIFEKWLDQDKCMWQESEQEHGHEKN